MTFDYDALILGAGPAGCSAAYDLVDAGKKVLLLDRRSFPRPKACACGLTEKTLVALRYSVESVIEQKCHNVVLQEAGPAFKQGRRTSKRGLLAPISLRRPFCAMAVRERFDEFCLEQTLGHGSHGERPLLRRIDRVKGVREFGSHVELDVVMPEGRQETFSAPVLVGADGSNGQSRRLAHSIAVQRASGVPQNNFWAADTSNLTTDPVWYRKAFALEACVPYTALPSLLPGGDDLRDFILDFSPILGGYGWIFPKGNHINIGLGGFVPREDIADVSLGTQDLCEIATRSLLIEYIRTKLGVAITEIPFFPDYWAAPRVGWTRLCS